MKHFVTLIGCTIFAAALIAGCGRSGDPDATPAGEETPQDAPAATDRPAQDGEPTEIVDIKLVPKSSANVFNDTGTVPFCSVQVNTATRAADSEKYALVYSVFTLQTRFGIEEIDPDPELFEGGSGVIFSIGRPSEGAGAFWGTQYFDAVPTEVTIKIPDDAKFTPGAVGASAQFWRLSENEWSPTTNVLTKTLEIQ